jgi:hypothetical protein
LNRLMSPFAFILIMAVLLSTEYTFAQQSCATVFRRSRTSAEVARYTQQVLNHLNDGVQKLYDTSGFKNNQEIVQAVKATPGSIGEFYRQALHILENADFEVAIRLPENIRLQIGRDGFLNSHETGNSQGAKLGRDAIEASYANMTKEQWDALPDEVKLKYAAAYPKASSNLIPTETLKSYTGTDRYYFKFERIRDSLTMTPGDSLNRFKYWQGEGFQPETPTSWDQMFVPWKSRYLLIPVIAEGLKQGRLGLPKIAPRTRHTREEEYGNQDAIVGEGPLAPYTMRWTPNMDYLEIHIWGRLTLDDVKIFEYATEPPTGEFLNELTRRGIEIRKVRK